ncbi:spindle pole body component 110-like [Aphidius gifuensis]|uniref:spindle pole body component 110-like n=1 Tax=Aphidius gifuensis TaxID=684658 RepID=UPI001CDBC051|nr:spindle pole body component 110-like [Aphidius gifuensis]
MSFSKAKILRFNERGSEAPAPGSYDPKFDIKVKGFTIEKKERFNDNKSVASSNGDCSKSVSSRDALPIPSPKFRTPQLPKKRITTKPTSAGSSLTKTTTRIPIIKQLKYDTHDEVADLKVECNNKDMTIREQEKYIDEMKIEIKNLEKKVSQLNDKQINIEQQHKNDIESMINDLKNNLELRRVIINNLECQLLSLKNDMDKLKIDNDKQIADLIERSNVNSEKKHDNNDDYQFMDNVLSRELHDFEMIYEDVKLGHQEVEVEAETEVDSGNNTGESLIENQSHENLFDSFVANEKNELNKKIAEKDAQILRLETALDDLTYSTATQASFCQSLQEELDRAEVELSEKKKEIKDMKQEMREEAAKLVSRRKKLDVIMEDNQATVAALSKRLNDSNVEIERLENELKFNKDLVEEYKNSLDALQKSSNNVNEKLNSFITQMNSKKDLIEEIEINSIADIESLKIIFEEKIDKLKEISEQEILKIQNICLEKEQLNKKLKQQLAEMADKLQSAQNMLLLLEEHSDAQLIKISQLQLAKEKLSHSMKINATEILQIKNQLNDEIENNKISTKQGEDCVNDLMEKIENMKKDLSYYENAKLSMEEEHIKSLENEKSLRKIAEEKINKLTESNLQLHKNYQEMTNKYTEILSQKNEQQNIKNYNQLKDTLKIIEKDLDEKNYLIDQQSKIIEKLQTDEKRRLTHIKGKENLSKSQISKSPFGTPVSSPHKPLTPLRDRNE